MENLNDEITKKQHYLRTKILDQGYDPQEFNEFMCEIKKEENIDLNNWTLQEIIDVVKSFKEYKQKKEIEEKQKKEKEKEIKNEEIQIDDIIKTNSINSEESEIKKKSIHSSSQTDSPQPLNKNEPFSLYEKFVKCEKLVPNQITNRDDLYITISDPKRVKEGFFSIAYYQYTVKTFPLYFNVIRRLSDFIFLSQKLPLIHPVKFIPEFPSFPFGLQDDSPKKMKFIQNYMNLLIENRYLRSLPIVYDFLTLPQVDWNNKVKNKYINIKEARQFKSMPNFDGQYYLKISKADEIKARNIKKDIFAKVDIYKIIDEIMTDLLSNFDSISYIFNNLAVCFNGLQSKYKNNNTFKNAYGKLYNIFKIWSEDYLLQKNFFRDEIQYFFLFINKELNTFLNNYENYRMARDDYTNIFEKVQKNKNPVEEDFSLLKSTKKYYAYELTTVNNEYRQLEERQKNRLLNQFKKYNENKNILFQDFKNISNLASFPDISNLKEHKKNLKGENKEIISTDKSNNQENNDTKYNDIKIQENNKDNNSNNNSNNNVIINNDNNVIQEQYTNNNNIIGNKENNIYNNKINGENIQVEVKNNNNILGNKQMIKNDNEDKTINKIENNLNENNIEDLKEDNITNENLNKNENKEENNKDINNEDKEENKNNKEKVKNNIEINYINEEQKVEIDKEKNKIDEEKNKTNEENKNT